MRINIEYESSWRNSFLDGNNNEPLPKQKDGIYRKFIGSMTSLKKPENYKPKKISNDTVMGILNRLIGDQKKLYQARDRKDYFFKELEQTVSFKDNAIITNEMTYIRNITGSTDQNSFTGAIKISDPMLTSDFSMELWGVLALTIEEVMDFILDDNYLISKSIVLLPSTIVVRADDINKLKAIENNNTVEQVIRVLNKTFIEIVTEKQPSPFIEKNGHIKPIRLYAAALYIQLERLSNRFDMQLAKTKAGKIAGFSKRGFNGKRDFIKNFVTGGEKIIWGNPYIHEEFIKGEGKVRHLMTKASGKLEITLDIDRTKAKEIKQMINNAGVSSFYLGKKGLAYVTDISTREVRT